MKNPTVSVVMITYGHENYIEEAIRGVFMQQTEFPVELIIANDCSPDNTDKIVRQIIKEAPEHIMVQYTKHSENKGMMPNFMWALEQVKGKYIAMCEGDDYWSDPLKLQKQVGFLEENPEYILSCHNYKILDFDGKTLRDSYEEYFVKDKIQLDIDEKMYLEHWLTKTLTVVLVNNPKIIEESQKLNKKRDLSFFYTYIRNGKGVFHNFEGAIYRRHPGGVHSANTAVQAEKETLGILEELFSIYQTTSLFKKIQVVKSNIIYYEYKTSAKKTIPLNRILKLKLSVVAKIKLIVVLFYNGLKKAL